MGRYRSCLIRAASEIDTYRAILRFARDPKDKINLQAFLLLLMQAAYTARWKVLDSLVTADKHWEGICYNLGCTEETKKETKQDALTLLDIYKKPVQLQDDWYFGLCEKMGVKVDREAIMLQRTNKKQ